MCWKKKAEAGELVLLYQDEGRFSLVPTLWRALGLKGERLEVGSWDNKDALYLFGALNAVDGRLSTVTQDWPQSKARRPQGMGKNRVLQKAFVRHLHRIARTYPVHQHERVVIVIDRASWHGGVPVREALAQHPHLELYRLPAYSPQLNKVERLWKVLRRRATHNRLFDSLKELRSSLQDTVKYFRSVRRRLLSLLRSDRKKNRTEISTA